MDNDATKMLNQNANQIRPQNGMPTPPPLPNAKKKSSHAGAAVAGAAVAGAAMGAGAAMAAEQVYGANADAEEKTSQETQDTQAEAQTAQKVTAEPEVKAEEKPETEEPKADTQQDDSLHTQNHTHEVADDEVRVVGMAVQDNGNGGVATVIGLQKGDDSALLIDVDSDGTADALIHDDNGNGTIEDNEVHDVSAEHISTNAVMEAYVADAQRNGEVATVTNLDTGEKFQISTTPDDGSVCASDTEQSVGGEEDGYIGAAVESDAPVPEDFHTVSDDTIDPMGDAFADAGTDDGVYDC